MTKSYFFFFFTRTDVNVVSLYHIKSRFIDYVSIKREFGSILTANETAGRLASSAQKLMESSAVKPSNILL